MDQDQTLALVKVRRLVTSGAAKSVRKAAGLSLPEVAEAVGSNPSTIHRWENNERSPHGEPAIRYGEFMQRLIEET
jgi:transcriptional regulator with XRE-family HTH domain